MAEVAFVSQTPGAGWRWRVEDTGVVLTQSKTYYETSTEAEAAALAELGDDWPSSPTYSFEFVPNVEEDGWHYVGETGEPTLDTYWDNLAGFGSLAFRLNAQGEVEIRGSIHRVSLGGIGLVFTLPSDYWPSYEVLSGVDVQAVSAADVARMIVATTGEIYLTATSPQVGLIYHIDVKFPLTTSTEVSSSSSSGSPTPQWDALGSAAAAQAASQPLDADLTAIAALTSPATSISKAPRPLFDHYTDAQSNNTPTETDLYSDTLAAGQLANNGDKLVVSYSGYWTTAARTKRLQFYFGGVVIFDTTADTFTGSSMWSIDCTIIRVNATTIRYDFSMISNNTGGLVSVLVNMTQGEQGGYTLSNTQIMKITGLGGAGAATGDITAQTGTVVYIPAA